MDNLRCKNCGAELVYANEQYVCNSCGGRYSVTDFYEEIDAYICYIETDEAGRRTKDSVLAQDIYHVLEQAKIKSFYSRISADKLSGTDLERVCKAAMHNARIILMFGTRKQHFEMLLEKYSAFLAGKVVIPVYADMDAYDIPKVISAIQAINYDKIGASVDLRRSVNNALGREETLDYATLTQKNGAKKKRILWISIAVITVVAGVVCLFFGPYKEKNAGEITQPTTEATQATLSIEELQKNQYDEAIDCVDSHNYVKAIALFTELMEYQDSEKQLNDLYQQYAGYYRNEQEGVSCRLQVWEGNAFGVELTKTTAGGERCTLTGSFQMEGCLKTFDFNDSENNRGQLSLQINNDGFQVEVNTTNCISEISMGSFSVAFAMTEKSDKPFADIPGRQDLLDFTQKSLSVNQLKRLGYEIEFYAKISEHADTELYWVKNSDIYFVVYRFDVSKSETQLSVTPETRVDDPLIVAINAPANIIIPDRIGEQSNAFIEGAALFVPGGSFQAMVYAIELLPTREMDARIAKDTQVWFTCEKWVGTAHYQRLAQQQFCLDEVTEVDTFFSM